MNKEFITYEQALALKELGFDEKCFYHYEYHSERLCEDKAFLIAGNSNKYYKDTNMEKSVNAPTFHQAFKFFREKYNLDGSMSVDVWNKKTTSYRIIGGIEGIVEADSYGSLYDMDSTEYDSYEESEQECLNKLIEIVKDK